MLSRNLFLALRIAAVFQRYVALKGLIDRKVSMKLFDSHCHLDDSAYKKDLPLVLDRARQAQVRAMMVVGVDLQSSERALDLAEKHPGLIASVGIHPHDAKTSSQAALDRLRELATHPKVRAWGETGLDFNRMYSPQKEQEHCFARQLEMGAKLGLPMIFHERDSQGRFLEILKTQWHAERTGIVHCFSGTRDELEAYLDLNLYIGITGILTIEKRGRALRELVGLIPEDRLLVETDAPYLTPSPERNKFRRNEPAFVCTVLEKLAQVRGQDAIQLGCKIWENSNQVYGLKPELC
jgi:TatD DNase family protein